MLTDNPILVIVNWNRDLRHHFNHNTSIRNLLLCCPRHLLLGGDASKDGERVAGEDGASIESDY